MLTISSLNFPFSDVVEANYLLVPICIYSASGKVIYAFLIWKKKINYLEDTENRVD